MELLLKRTTKTNISTISELHINGTFECYVLEDVDRGLDSKMPLSELKKKKVYAKTAIPTGKYEIVISFSNRFQKLLPLVANVPAYEGIRIHAGNTAEHTEGCLLPGTTKATNFVGNSKIAFNNLFKKIQAAVKKEKVFIEIVG